VIEDERTEQVVQVYGKIPRFKGSNPVAGKHGSLKDTY
jgi:hypothetical protein